MLRLGGTGPEDLARISRQLKGAPKDLRREVYKALERSSAPLKEAARAGAREKLPASGGLAARVAAATIRVRLRSGRNPSLTLTASQTGASAERFKKARAADKRKGAAARRAADGGTSTTRTPMTREERNALRRARYIGSKKGGNG